MMMMIINNLHKGDDDDDYKNNNNNSAIRSTLLKWPGQIKHFSSTEAHNISCIHLYNTVHDKVCLQEINICFLLSRKNNVDKV